MIDVRYLRSIRKLVADGTANFPRSAATAMFCLASSAAMAQDMLAERTGSSNAGGGINSRSTQSITLPYAQFQIPFNIDSAGSQPETVLLLVSTDNGQTWQQHGKVSPRDRHFDFRAASEGDYLFTVQTVDAAGIAFPSPNPPLRVRVDTTKPQATLRADLDHNGHLIVDLRVADQHIDLNTAILKVRTDRDSQWREVPVTTLTQVGNYFEAQIEIIVPQCREVAIAFSILDQAKNSGEASYMFTMPRTAANPNEMQFASTQAATNQGSMADRASLPGAVAWDPQRSGYSTQPQVIANKPAQYTQQPQPGGVFGEPRSVRPANPAVGNFASSPNQSQQLQANNIAPQGNYPTTPRGSNLSTMIQPNAQGGQNNSATQPSVGPGKLARATVELELGPSSRNGFEEIQIPTSTAQPNNPGIDYRGQSSLQPQSSAGPQSYSQQYAPENGQQPAQSPNQANEDNGINKPFYCRSRTFSLDYSVEALGGNALSEVELWGSEDNGRTWEKWGSDPDRVSPFDVKVGNDGLFGYRMVLVGAGGTVLGNPKPGEDADAWIRVDTESPQCKITRAVYGVGSEAGMLVIDYTCSDADLADEGVSISWSSSLEGPWTAVASAIKNSGLYLWKADPGLPNRVYLKLEAVDKAGNIGVHRLDLPIDTKGLSPRGRIQGIRPITAQN